ncbi:MAG: hypothetical protein ACI3V4_02520 [Faecousia sp.]
MRGKQKQSKQERQVSDKLRLWQERLAQSDREWAPEVDKMDEREAIYNGSDVLRPLVKGDQQGKMEKATHVRNIIFENIESQISASIPQPKVTARRKQDEPLAEIIENWIRNELNRQPFEMMNDMAERTVPIQGGVLFLQEWDNSKRTHNAVGIQETSVIHPKQLAPQPGIYTGIEDMDWVIVKRPTTKQTIYQMYGIRVDSEGESEPEIRGTGDEGYSEDAVTQYVGFARNDHGGIDRYSWVNDVELEDLPNYQNRRLPVCAECGRIRPMPGQVISNNVAERSPEFPITGPIRDRIHAGREMAGLLADQMMVPEEENGMFLDGIGMDLTGEPEVYDGGRCPWCGSDKWEDREQEYEEVILPVKTQLGHKIPGEHPGMDELGNPVMVPTKVPYYKPDVYPLVLQRSVSVYGQLLGNSDVDAIRDQQNTTNRIEKKIIDRILKAGSRITLPPKGNMNIDPVDNSKWYLNNPADKAMIGQYDFTGNLQYEIAYLSQVYEEARQILGITDSFQGRRDPTATSGKAKEYSAAMAAGRLESKRIMKNAAYAQLFELMFKFQLAYADEPRPVTYKDSKGETIYAEFNRYDFLEQDSDGQWYWNDQFLFDCDTSTPLASNREAMWQETRQNLQTGAFGDPASTETLILFWGKMEMLHYPGAAATKKYLEEKLQREQAQAAQMQMALQAQQQQAAQAAASAGVQQGTGI